MDIVERRTVEMRPIERSVLKVSASRSRSLHVGPCKRRMFEMRTRELGALKACVSQDRLFQSCPLEPCAAQVRFRKVSPSPQIGIDEDRTICERTPPACVAQFRISKCRVFEAALVF